MHLHGLMHSASVASLLPPLLFERLGTILELNLQKPVKVFLFLVANLLEAHAVPVDRIVGQLNLELFVDFLALLRFEWVMGTLQIFNVPLLRHLHRLLSPLLAIDAHQTAAEVP